MDDGNLIGTSAYMSILHFIFSSGKSFMKKIKSKGPMIDP
jgi:hypothetical protein